MLKNLKLKSKFFVILLPIFILIIALSIGIAALSQNVRTNLETALYDELYVASTSLINGDRDFYRAQESNIKLQSHELIKSVKDNFVQNYRNNYQSLCDNVTTASTSIASDEKAYSEYTLRSLNDSLGIATEDGDFVDMTFQELEAGFREKVEAWYGCYDPETNTGDSAVQQMLFNKTREYLGAMEEYMDAFATYELHKTDQEIRSTLIIVYVIVGIVSVLVLLLLIVVVKQLIKGIAVTKQNLDELASKNLTYEPIALKQKDELGQMSQASVQLYTSFRDIIELIGQTSDHINEVTNRLNVSTHDVHQATDEIATAINEIAQNVSSQAAETSDAFEQTKVLDHVVLNSNQTAESLAQISSSIGETTSDGMKMVEQLQKDTLRNEEAYAQIFKAIDEMETSAEKIAEASNLISEIASQTSLLSLNASIEAARAGESGRGFAVVATEIRHLADQSSEAVATIDNMLTELHTSVAHAATQKEAVQNAVKQQAASVQKTGEKYRDIVSRITDINQNIEALENLSQEMDSSCKSVVSSVNTLSDSAAACAANSQQTSASASYVQESISKITVVSDEISSLAEELNNLLVDFQM